MGGGKFEQASPGVLASVKAGASLADAARENDVTERSAKEWLTKGRNDPKSAYANFAFAIDFIREARDLPDTDEPVDDAEVQMHLSRAIRNGSVPAMKVWTDTYRKPGKDEDEKAARSRLDELEDELAPRRAVAG